MGISLQIRSLELFTIVKDAHPRFNLAAGKYKLHVCHARGLYLWHEAIALSSDADNMLGPGGVLLNIPPYPGNKCIHGSGFKVRIKAPDSFRAQSELQCGPVEDKI
jgi:hypothetical protein